jgi:CubicO group peptidase (beta-lactamase class C family)
MKKILVLLACCISLFTSTRAQHVNRDAFIKDSLNVYISKALTNWRIPGAAVCIIKDDKIVLMKGYGIKELGLPDKITEKTVFMIGSNTKAFTATAMAMLQENKRLSLDDKVTKYLPEFKLENKTATEQATIRDLLCHRLGFETFQGDFTFYNTNLTTPQIVEKMRYVKATYPFRSKWGYTNAAFATAGEIIPWVAGKTWDEYIKTNIFEPLGMDHTLALTKDIRYVVNRSVPHTLVDGRLTPIPYAHIDGLAPAGSICSSVNDLSKWVMALLNDGKVGNKQVIPAAAIQATRQPQDVVGKVKHLNGETDLEQYGLGWFLEDYAEHHLVMHTGGVSGFLTSITLVPQEHLGIIILTNTDQNELFETLRWEIMDAYFKMPYRNYSELYLNIFKANQAKKQQMEMKLRDSVALNLTPAMPSANYTGKYTNELYGNMTVTRGSNNDLEMRFEHHPNMYVLLQPLGGNRFYAAFSDPTLGKAVFPFTFSGGRITGVRIKVDDEIERNPYEFRKVE